jgi:hypothetical protein
MGILTKVEGKWPLHTDLIEYIYNKYNVQLMSQLLCQLNMVMQE